MKPAARAPRALVDLAIVGGGITGAGLARLAARHGLSVTLVERRDLMSGASSRSSHMLHGGLRYLEHGHLALVREALRERAVLTRMAPGLARPARFLVPLYRGGRVGPWKLRAGLTLYDVLAGRQPFAPHTMIPAREALKKEPALSAQDLQGAGLYTDVVMDDARLGIAVACDAAAHGAEILTWTEVVGARPGDGTRSLLVRDALTGLEDEIPARVLVIAAGAWTDEARRRVRWGLDATLPPAAPLLRPSRGSHLVYPALTTGHALVPLASDGRVFFTIPFSGFTLVGTTEIEVSSPPPPARFEAEVEELVYLRDSLDHVLPGTGAIRPLALTAGVRPLLRGEGEAGQLPREHGVFEEPGMIVVAGGKYTTFRVMARDTLERVLHRLGRPATAIRDPEEPLPTPPPDDLPLERRIHWAVREAHARRLEDVLRRRSLLWLSPDLGRSAASEVAGAMAPLLGWDEAWEKREVAEWDLAVHAQERLLDLAGWPPA